MKKKGVTRQMLHKPRDKALVEDAVKQIYRSIYPKPEDREFYDLESLNAAIKVTLKLHDNVNIIYKDFYQCLNNGIQTIADFPLNHTASA